MRSPFVVAGLLVVMLSGCVGGDDDPDDGDGGMLGDEGAGGTNATAQAVIAILENGTAVAPEGGVVPVPIGIDITFDGNGSTNAAGAYFWDFGDGATAAGAVTTHAYDEQGNYSVTLTVGSGSNTANATVLLNASVPVAAEPILLETVPFGFSGTVPLMNPNAANFPGVDHADHAVTLLDATSDGQPAMAREVRVHLEASGGAVQTWLYWLDSEGSALASATEASTTQDILLPMDLPAGEYAVRIRSFVGAAVMYTVTGEIDYYSVA